MVGLHCGVALAVAFLVHGTTMASRPAPEDTRPHRRSNSDGAVVAKRDHVVLVEGCDLAIVGAGPGGVYTAWRLAVDTNTVSANANALCRAAGKFMTILMSASCC